MTIEEKAKAYDRLAAKIIEDYETVIDLHKKRIDFVSSPSPESEDEKIRKAIITYLRSCHEPYMKEWIAYLEKQEAKEKYDRMAPIYKDRESFESALEKAWNNYRSGALLVDGFEDNRIELAHAKGFREGFLFGNQQKPTEWSEEDKEMVLFWNMYYEHEVGDWPNKDVVEHLERFREWLNTRFKSLRPKPKAELTLLDKNIIEAAVAFVEQNDHFNCYGGIDKHTVIKALRSLKPHWKPSEEQMEMLSYVMENRDDHCGDVLCSLYNDLKKL